LGSIEKKAISEPDIRPENTIRIRMLIILKKASMEKGLNSIVRSTKWFNNISPGSDSSINFYALIMLQNYKKSE
jgi:hypothetical protein